jgi:hypothetical protein
MGEAKRKRQAGSQPARAHWELVRVSGMATVGMIATGHPELHTYLELIARTSAWMHDRSRKKTLCITCDHEFDYDEMPEEFIVCKHVVPREDVPAICNALCSRCAQDQHILDRIVAVYRNANILGDITVPGG